VGVPFKELPADGQPFLRPVVDVGIAGHELQLGALVDTGALHNRFARWTAEFLGLDLDEGEHSRFAVGGVVVEAVTVPVQIALGEWTWSAPVSFCEPWPFGFQLLGQEGFLRFFRVLFVAAEHRLELDFEMGNARGQ
jgi:hypothetical protein